MKGCDPHATESDGNDDENSRNDNDELSEVLSESTANEKTGKQQAEAQLNEQDFLSKRGTHYASFEGEPKGALGLVISGRPVVVHTSDPSILSPSITRSVQDGNEQPYDEQPGAYPIHRRAPGVTPRHRMVADESQVETEIIATVVEDDEATLPTVYPTNVVTGESIKRKRRNLFMLVGVLMCFLIGMVVALVITQVGKESDKEIKQGNVSWSERNSLTCGIPHSVKGLGVKNADGNYNGFVVDLCYAIGAALFGEDYRNRTILYGEELIDSFSSLADQEVDLLVEDRTHTMERHVYYADEDTGFTFTDPYLYTGLVFGGDPFFVDCADSKNITGKCADLRVCVFAQSTHVRVVRDLFQEENIVQVSVSSMDEYYSYLNTDTCNVIAGEQPYMPKIVVESIGLQGLYEVGHNVFSKEPLAMMTRNDDPQWSDFVNWVLRALITAEQHNITQSNAHEMPATYVFGDKYKNMFSDAINAVGNYGEIYTRHMEAIVPRQGMNLINDGTSGLIYSHPFGTLLDDASSGHVESGILEDIFQRGYLKCGDINQITPRGENRLSSGLGVDYCYALSAGIFQDYSEDTKHNRTEIVSITQVEAASLLNNKEVDVIGPVARNLVNDVVGNMTFSQQIYYDSNGDPYALATWQYDAQWSSFVYWTVAATVYAEENNITQSSSDKMPLLNLFGPHHKMMMRQIVDAVGNYGDIYERNVDSLGPRAGLNMLNLDNGAQLYPFPGIFY